MADQKKLDRWADKLLDTGKRNNLINFRDTKTATACEDVFARCSIGHEFQLFDPKTPDTSGLPDEEGIESQKLSREEYQAHYASRIHGDKQLLVYAQAPNPLTAVKQIAKKAQEMQDETGINVAYLAFGFLKWNEKQGSDVFFQAPLLLVHVNIITGSIVDPVKIEISDDDVIVNPTFDYLLQAEYGLSLPPIEDSDSLSTYYDRVACVVAKLGWKVLDQCKLGIFSFLKINMYEDLKKNAGLILSNPNIQAILGETDSKTIIDGEYDSCDIRNSPIELHTVVDADSSQIEAIEMAKSGRSFVLQGPPGTGKSQTITNIIAECLHDGKKVLFVSEKQAALNVVFDKLKQAGLADFCLELHSHKASKKAVIEELNHTLEMPKSTVSASAQDEIRQKADAQQKLDKYALELHREREGIRMSLYQLFEGLSAQRLFPDVPYTIRSINSKGAAHLLQAVHLLEQYADYIPSIGRDYRENPWHGFRDIRITYEDREQLKTDLENVLVSCRTLESLSASIEKKYATPELTFSTAEKWADYLSFLAGDNTLAPSMLTPEACDQAYPHITMMAECSKTIQQTRSAVLEICEPKIISAVDGKVTFSLLTGRFSSALSRLFSGEYRKLIAGLRLYVKHHGKLKYRQAIDLSNWLMKLQAAMNAFEEDAEIVRGKLGGCVQGFDSDWLRVVNALETLKGFFRQGAESFGNISEMNPDAFVESKKGFRVDADALRKEIVATAEARDRVSAHFRADAFNLADEHFDSCISKIEGCLAEFDKLGNWISFMDLLHQIDDAGLTDFVLAVIAVGMEPSQIAGA